MLDATSRSRNNVPLIFSYQEARLGFGDIVFMSCCKGSLKHLVGQLEKQDAGLDGPLVCSRRAFLPLRIQYRSWFRNLEC